MEIPDFAQMSDDELNRHHISRGRDGRWSWQTQSLLDRFGTTKLSLNAAWASTWTGWNCPCCGRSKPEIARLTQHGVLLCQLDSHHDHLHEAIDDIFRERRTTELSEANGKMRGTARTAVHLLVERFDRTLICSDCNIADSKMKSTLGKQIPRYFSFSPSEIAKFIIAKSNAVCDLNLAIGRQVWEIARTDFTSRLAFAEELANRITNALHDKERGDGQWRRYELDDRDVFVSLISEATNVRSRPGCMGMALSSRSCANEGHFSSKATAAKTSHAAPTDADFANFDSEQPPHFAWSKAGPDWQCETCGRTKRQIMRKSNRGIWTAALHTLNDYIPESDWRSIEYRRQSNDLQVVISNYRRYQVCQDCRLIETEAGKLSPEPGHSILSKGAISRLVGVAAPNQRHDCHVDSIRAEIQGSLEWIAAVNEFWTHSSEAGEARTYLFRAECNLGADSRVTRIVAIKEWAKKHKLSEQVASKQFDWLIQEYERLKEADELR